MAGGAALDTVIQNVRVVRLNRHETETLDLGIRDGRFARIAPTIEREAAREVVDAHPHVGIYGPLATLAPGPVPAGRHRCDMVSW